MKTIEKPPASAGDSHARTSNLLLYLIPIAIGLVIWRLPLPAGVSRQGMTVLAVFAATIAGIIAKPLPMGAVAIIGIAVLSVSKTLPVGDALSGFSNATIWLIVLAFFIARGFIKTGLGRRIAYMFVAKLGGTSLGVAYGLLATDLVLAPAIPSNTARAGGVVNPIVMSISEAYDSRPNDGTARRLGSYLTLTAFNVNCVTSAMFVTAMAANPLAQELAAKMGIKISWGKWALAAFVPGMVSLAVLPWFMSKIHPPEVKKTPEATGEAKQKLLEMGAVTSPEKIMLGAFAGLLILWTMGDQLWGISATAAALAGLAALLITKVLTWEDIKKEAGAWDTLVWFAALVMMATKLNDLGVIKWFSGEMASVVNGMSWMWAFVILSLVYFYSHYAFASNTAHVAAMYAAFVATAVAAGAPPEFAALVFGFESSLFASVTHYSCGPAPVMFGTGYVTLSDWWRNGFIVSVVNIAIWTSVGGVWMKVLGIW